jgi:hypothetical protein
MYLKNNNKAICPGRVTDMKEWNFTGKPITQVIKEREQVSKQNAKRKSRSKETPIPSAFVPIKMNPGTINKDPKINEKPVLINQKKKPKKKSPNV